MSETRKSNTKKKVYKKALVPGIADITENTFAPLMSKYMFFVYQRGTKLKVTYLTYIYACLAEGGRLTRYYPRRHGQLFFSSPIWFSVICNLSLTFRLSPSFFSQGGRASTIFFSHSFSRTPSIHYAIHIAVSPILSGNPNMTVFTRVCSSILYPTTYHSFHSILALHGLLAHCTHPLHWP